MATMERPREKPKESSNSRRVPLLVPESRKFESDPNQVAQSLPVLHSPNESVAPAVVEELPAEVENETAEEIQAVVISSEEQQEQYQKAIDILKVTQKDAKPLYPSLMETLLDVPTTATSLFADPVEEMSESELKPAATVIDHTQKVIMATSDSSQVMDQESIAYPIATAPPISENIILLDQEWSSTLWESYANDELTFVIEVISEYFTSKPVSYVNSEFFQLIRNYYEHCNSLYELKSNVNIQKKKTLSLINSVYTTTEEEMIQSKQIEEKNEILNTSIKFNRAVYNLEKEKSLKLELDVLHDLRINKLILEKFQVMLHVRLIDDYINNYIVKSNLFVSCVNATTASAPPSLVSIEEQTLKNASQANEETLMLRHFIDVLFYFDNKYAKSSAVHVVRFVQQIHGWILYLASALLKLNRTIERAYLLNTILNQGLLDQEDRWYLPLVQFVQPSIIIASPSMMRTWEISDLEQFIVMLQLFLDKRNTQHCTQQPSRLHSTENSDTDINQSDVVADDSLFSSIFDSAKRRLSTYSFLQSEKMLEQDDEPSTDESNTQLLSEDDYIAIFQQCPYSIAFKYMFPIHLSDVQLFYLTRRQTKTTAVKKLFSQAKYVLNLLGEACVTFSSFSNFTKLLARCITCLVDHAAEYLVAISRDQQKEFLTTQILFDSLCLNAIKFICNSQVKSIRFSLSSLPLNQLSSVVSWRLFVAIMLDHYGSEFSIEYDAGLLWRYQAMLSQSQPDKRSSVSSSPKLVEHQPKLSRMSSDNSLSSSELFLKYKDVSTLAGWLQVVNDDPHHIRCKFLASLQKGPEDSSEAIYRLMLLSELGASQNDDDISSAILYELLAVGYLRTCTCDIKVVFLKRSIQDFLQQICLVKPELISIVLNEVSKNFDRFDGSVLKLFRSLPINLWINLHSNDVRIISSWLNTKDTTVTCAAAMEILDRLDYASIPPKLHFQLSIVIAEAYIMHQSYQADSALATVKEWIPLLHSNVGKSTHTFYQWCWALISRLKFYDDRTYQPLMPLMTTTSVTCIWRKLLLLKLKQETELINKLSALKSVEQMTEQDILNEFFEDDMHQHVVSLLQRLDPMLSYVLLSITNHVETASWLPLLVLVYQRYFKVACDVLYNIVPLLVSKVISRQVLLSTHWLLFLLYQGNLQPANGMISYVTSFITKSSGQVDPASPESMLYLNRFCNLIEYQLLTLNSFQTFQLWFRLFTSIPHWYSFPNVQIVLNCIARVTVLSNYSTTNPNTVNMNYLMEYLVDRLESSVIEARFNKVDSGAITIVRIESSMLPTQSVSWLALAALYVETCREWPLWQAFGYLLSSQNIQLSTLSSDLSGNLNGRDCYEFGHSNYIDVSQYKIYLWAKYIMNLSVSDPCLPLFVQGFVSLYFSRYFDSSDETKLCFGHKFFQDSVFGDHRMHEKKSIVDCIVTKLNECCIYYHENDFTNSVSLSQFFEAVSLWLKVEQLNEFLNQGVLSGFAQLDATQKQQYQVHLLVKILAQPLFGDLAVLASASGLAPISTNSRSLTGTPRMSTQVAELDHMSEMKLHKNYLWIAEMVDVERICNSIMLPSMGITTKVSIKDNSSMPFDAVRRRTRLKSTFVTILPPPVFLYNKDYEDQNIILCELPQTIRVYLSAYRGDDPRYNKHRISNLPKLNLFVGPLLDLCRLHGEFSEYLTSINTNMNHLLPKIYYVESQQQSKSVTHLQQEYKFTFYYEESFMNQKVMQSIHSLVDKSAEVEALIFDSTEAIVDDEKLSYYLKTMESLEFELCKGYSITKTIVNELISILSLSTHSQYTEGQLDIAKSELSYIFRQLLGHEVYFNRNYAPAKKLLWEFVSQIGSSYAVNQIHEIKVVFESMLDDVERIPLLKSIFTPHHLSCDEMISMYSALYKALAHGSITNEKFYEILTCFQFDQWILKHPSYDTRVVVYNYSSNLIRKSKFNQVDAEQEKDKHNESIVTQISKFHENVITIIIDKYFHEHIDDLICLLIGNNNLVTTSNVSYINSNTNMQPCHHEFWNMIFQQISEDEWKLLTHKQILSACKAIGNQFHNLIIVASINKRNILTQWNELKLIQPLFKFINKLIDTLLIDYIEVRELEEDVLWSCIATIFEPLLIYQDKNDNQVSELIVKESVNLIRILNLHSLQVNITVLSYEDIVGLSSESSVAQQKQFALKSKYFNLLMEFYIEKLFKFMSIGNQSLFFSELANQIDFSHWIMNEKMLGNVLSIVKSVSVSNHPLVLFLKNMLLKTNWALLEYFIVLQSAVKSKELLRKDSAMQLNEVDLHNSMNDHTKEQQLRIIGSYYADVLLLVVCVVCKTSFLRSSPTNYVQLVHGVAMHLPMWYLTTDQYTNLLNDSVEIIYNDSGTQNLECSMLVLQLLQKINCFSVKCIQQMQASRNYDLLASNDPRPSNLYLILLSMQKQCDYIRCLRTVLGKMLGKLSLVDALENKKPHTVLAFEREYLCVSCEDFLVLFYDTLRAAKTVLQHFPLLLDDSAAASKSTGLLYEVLEFLNLPHLELVPTSPAAQDSLKDKVMHSVQGTFASIINIIPYGASSELAAAAAESQTTGGLLTGMSATPSEQLLPLDDDGDELNADEWSSWSIMRSAVLQTVSGYTARQSDTKYYTIHPDGTLQLQQPKSQVQHRLVTAGGVGNLVYQFVGSVQPLIPLVIRTGNHILKSEVSKAGVLERCLEAWVSFEPCLQVPTHELLTSGTSDSRALSPIALSSGSLKHRYDLGASRGLVEEALLAQSALLALYCHSLSPVGGQKETLDALWGVFSNLCFTPQHCHKLLLLAQRYLQLLVETPNSSYPSPCKVESIRSVEKVFLSLSDEENALNSLKSRFINNNIITKNIVNKLSHCVFPLRFRLACRAVGIYFHLNSVRCCGKIRLGNFQLKLNDSDTTKALIDSLRNITNLKSFQVDAGDTSLDVDAFVKFVLEFVTDEANSLNEYRQFFKQLCSRLYPELKYLFVAQTELDPVPIVL